MRRLLGDSLAYLLSVAIPGAVGLALLPLTARMLGTAEYGLVELCTTLALITTSVLTLELPQGLARYLPEAGSAGERAAIGSTTLTFCGLTLGLASLVLLLVGGSSHSLPETGHSGALLWVAGALALLIGGLQSVAVRHLRWSLRAGAYLAAIVATSLASALLLLWLLLSWRACAASVLLAQAGGNLAGLLLALRLCGGELRLHWERAVFNRLARFSLPLVLSTLGVLGTTHVGRLLVAGQLGLAETGQLSLALRITGLLGLATAAFQMAVTPMIYARHAQADTPGWLAITVRAYLCAALTTWILVSEFAGVLVRILAGAAFAPAATLVTFLAAALLLNGVSALMPGLEIRARTRLLAAVTLLGGALSLVFTWWLLPGMGLRAAALGPLVATCLTTLLIGLLSQRHYPVPHVWWRLAAAAGISIIPVMLSLKYPADGLRELAWRIPADLCVVGLVILITDVHRELPAWLRTVKSG